MADFDFGFTLVDENELDVAQTATASAAEASTTQDKLDNYIMLSDHYSIT